MKAPMVGDTINLPAYAEQVVTHLNGMICWDMYASGKASIGRKASRQAVMRTLERHGFNEEQSTQFWNDVICILRTRQRATNKL